jgi:hypothetical protein
MSDSIEYIRYYYGVPAAIGGRVRFTGNQDNEPLDGTITGTDQARLAVRLDGHATSVPLHPTWKLEYLEADTLPDGVLVTPAGKLVVEW